MRCPAEGSGSRHILGMAMGLRPVSPSEKHLFAARWNRQDNPLHFSRGDGPGTGGFPLT